MYIKLLILVIILLFIIKIFKKKQITFKKEPVIYLKKEANIKKEIKLKKVSFNDQVIIHEIPNLTNFTEKDKLWYNARDYNYFIKDATMTFRKRLQ